jgi:opacity protein-like surface antigen
MKRITLGIYAIALMTAAASADSVQFQGDANNSTESTGSMYMGSMEYQYQGGNLGTLSIALINTTDAGIGGFLTGLVFDMDSTDAGAVISLLSTSDADFLDTGVESAGPFGDFDAGAALGANFNGGGTPSLGIAIDGNESFVFSVVASDADILTSSSFFGDGDDFYVRFRGLINGESDMVGVPAPGTTTLALIGLSCMTRRRR